MSLCRCSKCANFDCSLESPASGCHKGASVLATYSEEDGEFVSDHGTVFSLSRRSGLKLHLSFLCLTAVDQKHWKKLTGHFSNIMVCPHSCLTHHAPYGFSPYGHIGNGCTDIVLLNHCSKFSHARWLMRQRKNRDMVRKVCVNKHPLVVKSYQPLDLNPA